MSQGNRDSWVQLAMSSPCQSAAVSTAEKSVPTAVVSERACGEKVGHHFEIQNWHTILSKSLWGRIPIRLEKFMEIKYS